MSGVKRMNGNQRAALRFGAALTVLTMALAMAQPDLAQSFQGNYNIVHGVGVTVDQSVPNQTTISIPTSAPNAIIDWKPTPAPGDTASVSFQPGGVANFVGGSGMSSFTILNRIMPTTDGTTPLNLPITMNGAVNSTVNPSGVVGANVRGGNVWFYSPYGIVIGSTATFNVGSLLLTTSAIDTTGDTTLPDPSTGINFTGVQSPTSSIIIQNGAVLNAAAETGVVNGSYIGMVAPRIEQHGMVNAAGMVGYAAMEAGTLTFSTGLVMVQVNTGTSDPNGIVHDGTTTGPSNGGLPILQTIKMVAVPKNDALTMLLSGTIGFATSASTDGGVVTLYAGYDDNYAANGQGSITIGSLGNTSFLGGINATASNAIAITPNGIAGHVNFDGFGDNNLNAGTSISMLAGQGQVISAVGALNLDASNSGAYVYPLPGNGAAASGGMVTVLADQGGAISASNLTIRADGTGADGDIQGGTGTGGQVSLTVSGGGSITAQSLNVSASGFGGAGGSGTGGNGAGGTVQLRDLGGALAFDTVSLSAWGSGGGDGMMGGNVIGGNATSGNIGITIAGQAQNWSSLSAQAYSQGGAPSSTSAASGSALAGADGISLHVTGPGSLTVGDVALQAIAEVSAGSGSYGGTGGKISLMVDGGGTLAVSGSLQLAADARLNSDSFGSNPAPAGPVMLGGNVSVLVNGAGSTITTPSFYATANAATGGAEVAGSATGGTVAIGATNGGALLFGSTGDGVLDAEAVGQGHTGPAPSPAFGGTVHVYADGGTIGPVDTLTLDASATGSSSDEDFFTPAGGFAATGGKALLEVGAGGGISATTIAVAANGDANRPNSIAVPGEEPYSSLLIEGNGGTGTGGSATIRLAAGTLSAAQVTVQAAGVGGSSDLGEQAFVSGDGYGGSASFVQSGGSATVTSLKVVAKGYGGSAFGALSGPPYAPSGGNGTGGTAQVSLAGGTLSAATALSIDASGWGGDGVPNEYLSNPGGSGGNAIGGLAELVMPAGSTALLTTPDLEIRADALAGLGSGGTNNNPYGSGGNAIGGTAQANLADGGFALGNAYFSAEAYGGAGTLPGTAAAGTAGFLLSDTTTTPSATRQITNLALDVTNYAGTDPSGGANGATTAGTLLLTVNAGSAAGALTLAQDLTLSAQGDNAPAGNGFTGSFGAVPFTVTGNVSIDTPRNVQWSVGAGGNWAIGGNLTVNARDIAVTGVGATSVAGAATQLTATGGSVSIVSSLQTAGDVSASGQAIDLASAGALAIGAVTATAGNISVQAGNGLTVASANASGTVSLGSGSGAFLSSGAISGTSITIASGGALEVDQAITTPGALSLTAAGPVTLAGATAANGFSLDTTGAFTTTAGVTGSTIAITADSISLGSGAFLGDIAGTSSITLNRAGKAAADTTIGGTGSFIDASGLGLLHARQSITIDPGDIFVQDMTITWGNGANYNLAPGGTFTIAATGKVTVVGNVRGITTGDADRLSFQAANVDVVTQIASAGGGSGTGGSITMADTAGNPQGRLDFQAGTVRVGTQTALNDIAALGSIAGISDRLGVNDGPVNNAGFIQAGQILVSVGQGFFVQNSGAVQDSATLAADPQAQYNARRGFGANGLTIATTSSSAVIAINGVLLDAAGAPHVQGLDVQHQLSLSGGFAPGSTINGCGVGQDCSISLTQVAPDGATVSALAAIPEDTAKKALALPVIQIEELPAFNSPPLIDEPITGIGNDDLWHSSCSGESHCTE